MSIQQFRYLTSKPDVPLLETALLISKNIATPDLDIPYWVEEIKDIAGRASENLPSNLSGREKMTAVVNWLFDPHAAGEAFSGNKKYYGDPRNSFINEVLHRKLGIPITLSIVCVEVTTRLGLNFQGIGLPGHFVVGGYLEGEKLPVLYDPFNNGKHITTQECAKLVERTTGYLGTFEEEWLQPASNSLIIIRMLNNLRVAYMRQENWAEAITVLRHLQLIQAELPAHWRDEGLIHYHLGNFHKASELLEEYISQNPHDADYIKKNIGPEIEKWARLN